MTGHYVPLPEHAPLLRVDDRSPHLLEAHGTVTHTVRVCAGDGTALHVTRFEPRDGRDPWTQVAVFLPDDDQVTELELTPGLTDGCLGYLRAANDRRVSIEVYSYVPKEAQP